MADWLDKVINAFHHPLAAMMFFVGVILILMGVTDGIPLTDGTTLQTQENFRYIAVGLGVSALMVAVVVYYKPPIYQRASLGDLPQSADDTTENILHPGDVNVAELSMSWLQKRDILSQTQRNLLNYIEQRQSVSYITLLSNFSDRTNNEMFYRLEQLRLLGFVVCDRVGKDSANASNILYTLSESYEAEASSLPHGARTLFATETSR